MRNIKKEVLDKINEKVQKEWYTQEEVAALGFEDIAAECGDVVGTTTVEQEMALIRKLREGIK